MNPPTVKTEIHTSEVDKLRVHMENHLYRLLEELEGDSKIVNYIRCKTPESDGEMQNRLIRMDQLLSLRARAFSRYNGFLISGTCLCHLLMRIKPMIDAIKHTAPVDLSDEVMYFASPEEGYQTITIRDAFEKGWCSAAPQGDDLSGDVQTPSEYKQAELVRCLYANAEDDNVSPNDWGVLIESLGRELSGYHYQDGRLDIMDVAGEVITMVLDDYFPSQRT